MGTANENPGGLQDHAVTTRPDQGGRVATNEPTPGEQAGDAAILVEARERRAYYESTYSKQLEEEADDLRFANGEQWDEAVKNQRVIDKRPCLTVNQTGQFVKQVTNDARQNRPRIVLDPVDEKADKQTAKVRGGIIRHIEYASAADAAYDTAFERVGRAGRGAWRVVSEYCDPMSFVQELRIKRIADAFMVRCDPNANEADGSDKNWAFVDEVMTEQEHERRWPGRPVVSMDDAKRLPALLGLWRSGTNVVVSDYYLRKWTKERIRMLDDGTVIRASDQVPEGRAIALNMKGEPVERDSWFVEVEIHKINGAAVLERTKWPGTLIPVIEIYGDEIIVDGKVYRAGIIRPAKDPQRAYNYWITAGTEQIALLPKAPYIGAEGQFSGHEAKWRQANVVSYSYLEYKPKTIGGQLVPPPARQPFGEVPAGIVAMIEMARQDMRAATGQYRPGDLQGPERSGRAIRAEQEKGDVVTFNFQDNLSRGIKLTGIVLNEVLPVFYDTERDVRIVDEAGQHATAKINSTKDGKPYNNLRAGKYSVTVNTGPSYQSKRAEARAWLIDFMATLGPQGAALIGDLVARKSDLDDADEIANRLFAMLPPQIQQLYTKDALDNVPEEAKPIVTQLVQQIGAMQQELQKYQTALAEAAKQLDDKNIILASENYRADVKELGANYREELRQAVELAVKGFGSNIEQVVTQVQTLSQGLGQVSEFMTAMQKRMDEEAAARAKASAGPTPTQVSNASATGVVKEGTPQA